MAVIAMWKCDRDGSMFENKKDADAYDKMLELGEGFAAFIESQVEGVDEALAENIGLALARHKDRVVAACKGKTEALELSEDDDSAELDEKVTPISAKA